MNRFTPPNNACKGPRNMLATKGPDQGLLPPNHSRPKPRPYNKLQTRWRTSSTKKHEGNKRTGRASPVCPVQQEHHFVSPKEDQPSGVPDAVGIPRAGWALFKGTKLQRRPLRFHVSLTRKICKAIIEGTEKGNVSKAREYLVFLNRKYPKH
jgi:hypothetical protein